MLKFPSALIHLNRIIFLWLFGFCFVRFFYCGYFVKFINHLKIFWMIIENSSTISDFYWKKWKLAVSKWDLKVENWKFPLISVNALRWQNVSCYLLNFYLFFMFQKFSFLQILLDLCRFCLLLYQQICCQ